MSTVIIYIKRTPRCVRDDGWSLRKAATMDCGEAANFQAPRAAPDAQDWDRMRPQITSLWKDKKRKLDDIAETLGSEHKLHITLASTGAIDTGAVQKLTTK